MLYGWMKSLIVYLLFSALIMNLSPGSSYKKYIRLFTGLIMVLIIARPLVSLFNIDEMEMSVKVSELENYHSMKENQNISGEMYDYYELSMQKAIELLLKEKNYEVTEVSVITDEANQILSCRVYGHFYENDIEDIKNMISDVYNLKINNIYVVSR